MDKRIEEIVKGVNSGSDGYVRLGKFVGIRRYGGGKHVQVTSFMAPTQGNEEVVLSGDDLGLLGLLFIELGKGKEVTGNVSSSSVKVGVSKSGGVGGVT